MRLFHKMLDKLVFDLQKNTFSKTLNIFEITNIINQVVTLDRKTYPAK